mgnify:FL=1|jgi:hypothetical protein
MSRQCELMDLPHTIFYHMTKPVQDEDLVELIAQLASVSSIFWFYGSRPIRYWLGDRGYHVNRPRGQRLMFTVALAALYPKRNLSQANQSQEMYL